MRIDVLRFVWVLYILLTVIKSSNPVSYPSMQLVHELSTCIFLISFQFHPSVLRSRPPLGWLGYFLGGRLALAQRAGHSTLSVSRDPPASNRVTTVDFYERGASYILRRALDTQKVQVICIPRAWRPLILQIRTRACSRCARVA